MQARWAKKRTINDIWVAFGKGRTIVGVDPAQAEFNAPNKTGGTKTVTLNINQMPSHHHGFKNASGVTVLPTIDQAQSTTWGASFTNDSSYKIATASGHQDVGGGQAHSNLQPYISVYQWLRTV